jgi:hypothetical protein
MPVRRRRPVATATAALVAAVACVALPRMRATRRGFDALPARVPPVFDEARAD